MIVFSVGGKSMRASVECSLFSISTCVNSSTLQRLSVLGKKWRWRSRFGNFTQGWLQDVCRNGIITFGHGRHDRFPVAYVWKLNTVTHAAFVCHVWSKEAALLMNPELSKVSCILGEVQLVALQQCFFFLRHRMTGQKIINNCFKYLKMPVEFVKHCLFVSCCSCQVEFFNLRSKCVRNGNYCLCVEGYSDRDTQGKSN